MEHTQNYIHWIRSKVGHKKIILVFAGGCIRNDLRNDFKITEKENSQHANTTRYARI